MATLQPTSTVTTPSTIGGSSPSTARQRGSTSASVLDQVREPPAVGAQKKGKGFLQSMFKNRLSSFASLFWNDQAKQPRESTSGSGSLIPPNGKEGYVNNNDNNNNAGDNGIGRRNRRSSTLSSSSIPMNELSRTSQPDVSEITRLKIPELKDDALILEIDPCGSLLTDIENSFRAILGNLESGLVLRSKIRRAGSIEIFALDNAADNTADALLIVYATEDGRSTDESIAISTNEKLIQNDPSRSHAISLVITGPMCETKVVYSKRTGKGPQVKISEPFPFFDLTNVSEQSSATTMATKRRRISCRTISAMTWANKDIISHLATRNRLNMYQLRPTRFLGMGSTAAVCEAELPCQPDQSYGEKVAVKTIDNPDVFNREWKILKAVQGYQGLPELIAPIPELKTLVTAPVGTPLHRTKIGMFTTGEPFIPVVRGMRGLRTRGIVHRDISPGNLIVTTKPDSVDLRLIDLGMAQKFSIHPKPYSGARSFASDKISGFFAARGLSWSDMDVSFGYEDDMESLIKTAVWTLDYQARKIINECAGKKKLEPKDVQRMWARVWVDTKLGQVAYGFLVEHVRAVEPRDHSMVPLDLGVAQQDALHDRVCEWLSSLRVVMT